MDEQVKRALERDRTIDITTTGRKTELPRRIEIWFHNLDGRLYITGQPGHRDWYANMVINREFTFHLKGSIKADLPARARPITDEAERGRSCRTSSMVWVEVGIWRHGSKGVHWWRSRLNILADRLILSYNR